MPHASANTGFASSAAIDAQSLPTGNLTPGSSSVASVASADVTGTTGTGIGGTSGLAATAVAGATSLVASQTATASSTAGATSTAATATTGSSFYGGYYGSNSSSSENANNTTNTGNQIMDLAAQYQPQATAGEPLNTALGLHELGVCFGCVIFEWVFVVFSERVRKYWLAEI